MKTARIVVTGALLATFAISCRSCRRVSGPSEVLALAGPHTFAAALVPKVGGLAQAVEAFATRATRKAAGAALSRFRDAAKRELGLDPLSTADLQNAGIDTDRGALLFTEGKHDSPLLAVGITNHATFEKALADTLKRVEGATQRDTVQQDGQTLQRLGRPFGSQSVPVVLWAYVGHYVLFAHPDGRAALGAALKRLRTPAGKAPAASLATDPTYAKLAAKVKGGAVRLFARGSAAAAMGVQAPAGLRADSMTALRLGAQGFSVDSFTDLPGLHDALAGAPCAPLAGQIDPDAVALLLTRVARPAGLTALDKHPHLASLVHTALDPLGSAIGVDPEKEVVPLLAGPLVASVHFHNLASLPQLLRQRSLDAALDVVHAVVVAQVKDPKAMLGLLERSKAALAKQGVTIRQRQVSLKTAGSQKKATVFEPDVKAPTTGWAVFGNSYVYAAGSGRLDQTLTMLAKGPTKLPQLLRSSAAVEPLVTAKDTSVFVLRSAAIAKAAASLHIGRAGVGLGAVLGSAIEVLQTLGDIGVGVTAEPKGLRLQVREVLQ